MSEFLAYGTLLGTASACVVVGSFASLHTPIKTRELRKNAGIDENLDEEEGQSQSLSSGNAYMFPIIGSAVLFSMYLAFKYLDKKMINMLLNFYFAIAGAFAIPTVLEHLVKVVRGGTSLPHMDRLLLRLRVPYPTWKSQKNVAPPITNASKPINLPSNHITIDLFGFLIMGAYLYTRSWFLTDFVAVCFAIQGIMIITLDTFQTGFILLAGLFFYDIFWVFGSAKLVKGGPSVMVSVATNFDGPIKILFPKNLLEVYKAWSWSATVPKLTFALLGLGDIVIPGVFVALALRLDQMHASKESPNLRFTRFFLHFPKPYFTACLIAYVAGLLTTITVMHVFGAAQPALLYLSPACALSVLLVALQRAELSELWSWVDHTTEPSHVEKAKTN
ncbi:hypothetical protein MYAM1_001296 [Malassezia yamatoensis]|uniref:Uncharacterized protein n=1 Tax=Malassezia yamatoensis TaxID=253288 RepID=A0AAJ5YRL4_9BASI|nr:hypothetical protein MYAM1_001296 [Malassezia yamatoensis]